MLRIISKGGKVQGTKVYQDGVELDYIKSVAIHPLEIDGNVSATIVFNMVELDIEAHAELPDEE